MAVLGLDHVNFRTLDVAASAGFYVDLFGFSYRQGAMGMGFTGHWLHDAHDQPIIHLRVLEAESTSTGPLDHVALRCAGMAGILQRLRARDIPFRIAEGLTPGLTQVFVKDPHGVLLELNFTGESDGADA